MISITMIAKVSWRMKMNNKKLKWMVGALLSATILVSASFATRAYFTSKATVQSSYKVVKVTTEIKEEVDTAGKKDVQIVNTGTAKCYVRARVCISPEDSVQIQYAENGQVISAYNEKDWIQYGGYYYYKYTLNPGSSTTSLFTNYGPLEQLKEIIKEEGSVDISVYEESIQANVDAEGNGIDPVAEGALTKEALQAWEIYDKENKAE